MASKSARRDLIVWSQPPGSGGASPWGPATVRKRRRDVLGVAAELDDVLLGQAQVFQEPPRRMRQAGRFGAAQLSGHVGDGCLEIEIGPAAARRYKTCSRRAVCSLVAMELALALRMAIIAQGQARSSCAAWLPDSLNSHGYGAAWCGPATRQMHSRGAVSYECLTVRRLELITINTIATSWLVTSLRSLSIFEKVHSRGSACGTGASRYV
jgi:hypothetical protein